MFSRDVTQRWYMNVCTYMYKNLKNLETCHLWYATQNIVWKIPIKCIKNCKKWNYENASFFRPRPAKYTIGICFETAKKTKAFECFFTGFQHSLWKFSTNGNLYSLKSWLWLAAVACVVRWPAAVACVVRWPISNALLNHIWFTRITRMCILVRGNDISYRPLRFFPLHCRT